MMKTTTDDGGPDPNLDEILAHIHSITFNGDYIERRLLNHGDYTCQYFSSQISEIADSCRSILAKVDTLK